jgi:hypothetical protein
VKILEPGKVYYQGDVVTHDGGLWQAVRDTGRGIPHDDWRCLARCGRDAQSPEVRGTYDTRETYQRLDIVACDGASFIAKRDNPGMCPGEDWQMMSRQGKPGRKGEDGERGLRGEKGETGAPGADAPEFVRWQIDCERYRASPLMSNGKVGEPLELREMFVRFLQETRDD